MDSFAANTQVTVEIPYVDNGNPLTLTDFTYEVTAADGSILIPSQSDPNFNPTDTASTLIIPAVTNVTTEKLDVRVVNYVMVTATGSYSGTYIYQLKGDTLKLTVMVDSFQTYPEAIINRTKISENLTYYDALTDELKVVALENAYYKLSKLKFQVSGQLITDITTLDESQFNALDPKFKTAIKKAQIVETNNIVENSPISEKIRSGIISETIGESSMFFNSKFTDIVTIYKGISDDAYPYLEDYIYRDTTSAQIWRIRRA